MSGFEAFLEKQKELPEYFQTKVLLETKLVVSDEYAADDEFIEEAIIFIEDNIIDSEFGISSLTDNFHMSQSSLFKKIKGATGLSPTMFIRSVRLKNAAKIILEKNYEHLSEVSAAVGFNDYRYFKKSFKKHYGCLPAEYKKFFLSDLYDRLVFRRKISDSRKKRINLKSKSDASDQISDSLKLYLTA